MPLDGSVFLALWNDFDPARDVEYERWHGFEHVPERVGVPGMIRGRRYRAADRTLDRFFTLYEVRDDAVLTSAPYIDLVQNPTDWSKDMRPSFRNVLRMPCETLLSVGRGTGGHIATARLDLPRALSPCEIDRLRLFVSGLSEGAPATAFHAGAAIASLSDYPVFKFRQAKAADVEVGSMTLVAEAGARDLAGAALRRASTFVTDLVQGARALFSAEYDLVLAIAHRDLDPSPNGRLPPRPDLRSEGARVSAPVAL